MLKATINLNENQFVSYQHLDLEKDWKEINIIRIYLKARRFNLDETILVTKKDNTLNFFQSNKNIVKNVVIVHPNSDILEQLVAAFKTNGHSVFAFKKVKEANDRLKHWEMNSIVVDYVIIPEKLEVSYNYLYKNFLNRSFPKYKVLTVDNRNYRDTMTIKELTKAVL